ncbi:MAG: HAD-IIB family hydrolase [Gammaproteobacteria bacterium]
MNSRDAGLYIALISVHGLIRGEHLELGRDADTGGQTKYVVELTRALAAHPDVQRVDLITRRILDDKVDPQYAVPQEPLTPKATIVRLPCGPHRYLRKELLWPYLDGFADQILQYFQRIGRIPDVVHAHYADAGYAGTRVAGVLGVPLVFTGHSLGRVKRQRLMEQGVDAETIEAQYHITRRIAAEEFTLDAAELVITSTNQEIEEQYALYDNHQPRRMVAIPPGVDLTRFRPPRRNEPDPPIKAELIRFLQDPDKPMILAVSRADERKNIGTLVQAYAEHPRLRELANLVVVAGNRDHIPDMDPGPRDVLTDLLVQVDSYDLYGAIAYPPHHEPDDIPDLYRLAAKSHGVFVNPALTEPFGLTLIEAAASGLPVVATWDGGPRDILKFCKNGLLVDPLDPDAIAAALLDALSDRERWQRWARNGIRGAAERYSWTGHVKFYLRALRKLLDKPARPPAPCRIRARRPAPDRLLICDIDNTLLGDAAGLRKLKERLRAAGGRVGFGVATGRRLESALQVLEEWEMPVPDVLITAVGTEIHYGPALEEDLHWRRQIDYRWKPEALRKALRGLPGIRPQAATEQRRHKLSYFVDPALAPSVEEIQAHLRRSNLHANVIYSHQAYLDLLPIRASKGYAIRYLATRNKLPLERLLVAGDSGNDAEMLCGDTLGVVVGNHSPELAPLRGRPRIYFAAAPYAQGILEGIEHYDFFGSIRIPGDKETKQCTPA